MAQAGSCAWAERGEDMSYIVVSEKFSYQGLSDVAVRWFTQKMVADVLDESKPLFRRLVLPSIVEYRQGMCRWEDDGGSLAEGA